MLCPSGLPASGRLAEAERRTGRVRSAPGEAHKGLAGAGAEMTLLTE